MSPIAALEPAATPRYTVHHDTLSIQTRRRIEFIDITDLVLDRVRRTGVSDGTVNVQTLHTTTAIRVNEHEPRLLEDLEALLERLAPRSYPWLHDDLEARSGPLPPGERPNGHAHARALLLGTSETLNIASGEVQLGRWQRVFLVELDGRRQRTVSLAVAGLSAAVAPSRAAIAVGRSDWQRLS